MTDDDATALARRIRSGELSPVEVVDAAIERAEAANPELNAIVAPTFDAARSSAKSLVVDDQPFAGVPILLKDLGCPVEGDPAYQGNRVLRDLDHRHSITGAVGRRLGDAGTISLGRTHSPEFGSGNCPASSETAAFGPTRNPHDPARTPMGSSGGAAAAVAAGIVPIAQASDGGGSIRMPASACGVVGLKASRGRISGAPAGAVWGGGATDGAVTRSVRDAALALDVLAGPELGDPFSAEPFAGSYVDEVGKEPEVLRCGLCAAVSYAQTDADCNEAVLATGRALDQLGHLVDEDFPADFDRLDYLYDYIRVIRASGAFLLNGLSDVIGRAWTEDDVEDGTWRNYQRGLKISAADYVASQARLHDFTRRMLAWWEQHDVLVTPTLATPPPELGYLVGGDDRQRRDRLGATMPFTAQFNVTGQPAISLPLHWTSDGLPIGVQLVAAPGREDVLIRLAAQLEQSTT